jgi:ABC-type transport system substrate-binding protein
MPNKIQSSILSFFKKIDFTILSKPKVINMAFKKASSLTKLLVLLELGLVITSLVVILVGVYYVATTEVSNPEAELMEGVVVDFKNFNPLFSPANSVEKRITSFLYQPLYNINYPEFGVLGSNNVANFEPVLLKSLPTSTDDKVFNFKLRDDLSWTDGSKLSSKDVKYTFDILKAEKGTNDLFHQNFQTLDLEVVNETEFTVISANKRPTLNYEFNLSPVSEAYMKQVPFSAMLGSDVSTKPQVTSGLYKLSSNQIIDKNYSQSKPVDNPIKNNENQIQVLKLETFTNTAFIPKKRPNSKFWTFKRYDSITANNLSSVKNLTLQNEARTNGKLDLFLRNSNERGNLFESSKEISDSLKLRQNLVQNNSYLAGYFNLNNSLDRTKPATKLAFRKYISCFLYDFEMNNINGITPLEKNKRHLPTTLLNNTIDSGCSPETETLPESDFKKVDNFYQFNNDPILSFDIVYFGYSQDKLTERLKTQIESKLGIKVNLTTRDNNQEFFANLFNSNSLELNKFDMILLPHEVSSFDLNSEFKTSYTKILGSSEDVKKLEPFLDLYKNSLYSTEEGLKVSQYLVNNKLSVYLGRYQTEINHKNLIGQQQTLFEDKNGILDLRYKYWYNSSARDWFYNKQNTN